ncbi:MAG: FG-GAP-like repeat-containing protein, partial [Myxococcota bacterium]
ENAVYPLVVDPLLTGLVDTEFESNQSASRFGSSVASAGDVNGDGFAGVIIGAHRFDSGETDEGAAFIFLGSPSGIADGNPLNAHAMIESNQIGANLGESVASAGDVNGDGYSDIIVGSGRYTNGEANEGIALVFHGAPTGIADGNPGTANAFLEGNQASAFFGAFTNGTGAVGAASAGDVNGDGYSDVIVGAKGYDNGENGEGAAFIFHGSASGISSGGPATADTFLESNQALVGIGFSAQMGVVASAGDVNGDGYDDVIVGAPGYTHQALFSGVAWVFHGGPAGVPDGNPGTSDGRVESNDSYSLGEPRAIAVASAGDVNGDGYADVIVGFEYSDDGAGKVLIVHGSASGIGSKTPTNADALLETFNFEGKFGNSVASAGDVNGDGYADVLIGQRDYFDGANNAGRAWVLRGSPAGIPPLPEFGLPFVSSRIVLGQGGARLGFSVASAGDVNGDGYDDILGGAPFFDGPQSDEGQAFLFLGGAEGMSDGSPLTADTQIESNQALGTLGNSVSTAGDINGDGYSDIIVGARDYDAGENGEGAALIFLGSAAGVGSGGPSSVHALLEGDQDSARFGYSVASAGDVNGDGYSDVVVGSDYYDNGESNEGAAFLFLGSAGGIADGNPSTAHAQFESNQVDAFLGVSVASAGDVNGDGYSDVIVGSSAFEDGELNEGAAFVFLGSAGGMTDGNPNTAHAQFESNQSNASIGFSVASAGDVNGDGYSDVIVGAPLYDDGESDEGVAFVFLGSVGGLADGTPGTANAQFESNQTVSRLGFSVASAGDVNGDGYSDVIVGSPNYDSGQSGQGSAFLFLGSVGGMADGTPSTAHAQFEANQTSSLLGFSVASAGDVNGDGYSDVIVGAPFYENGSLNDGAVFVFLGTLGGMADGTPSTAHAQIEPDQTFPGFGVSVASAGDVNGDGYSDVIVGSELYSSGESGEGSAFIFHGSPGAAGPLPMLRQLRGDGSGLPVQALGRSESGDGFRVQLFARPSSAGRELVKLEIEACPSGTPFTDPACTLHQSATWIEVQVGGPHVLFDETISGLSNDTVYRWRARNIYAPFNVTEPGITPPPNPQGGPWRRIQSAADAGDIRVVPEPGTIGVVIGSLVLAAMARRRRDS